MVASALGIDPLVRVFSAREPLKSSQRALDAPLWELGVGGGSPAWRVAVSVDPDMDEKLAPSLGSELGDPSLPLSPHLPAERLRQSSV